MMAAVRAIGGKEDVSGAFVVVSLPSYWEGWFVVGCIWRSPNVRPPTPGIPVRLSRAVVALEDRALVCMKAQKSCNITLV
jgi:hypothetical protein